MNELIELDCIEFISFQINIKLLDRDKKQMTSSFSTMRQLPVHGLYHMHNYSSDSNWLAYQVTLNQVRLIRYNENISVRESFVFQFPTEPIKQIKIIVDEKQDVAYLAVLFLTKYVIYKNNTELCSYRLKLDKNIVVFENSFVACDAHNDSKQIYFTFLTAKGQIHQVSVDNIGSKFITNFTSDSRFCSIKVLANRILLGDQQGKVQLVDFNNQTLLKSFDTGSSTPILQIKSLNQKIIIATCQGEIFNLAQDLSTFTSLSVHQGLVSHMGVEDNTLYTFGDDAVLNVFEVDKNEIKLRKSQKYTKKANMLITLHSLTFLNFYEETSLQEVTLA